MTLIGSAYVEIRALDDKLKRDIDAAAKKIKDITLNVRADVDLAPVRKKITELRAEIRKNPLKFEAIVDDSGVLNSYFEAQQLYDDNPLHVDAFANTEPMERALDLVHSKYGVMQSTVVPHAHTKLAEAQLKHVSRPRNVPLFASTFSLNDKDIRKAIEGFTYSLMGMIPPDLIKKSVSTIAGDLERLSFMAALAATAIGSLSASVITLGANLFSVGADMTQVVGLFAALPAVMYAGSAALIGTKIAWKGFAAAFDEDAEKAAKALAKLPPEAQEAVKALRGVWGEISRPAQNAFWREMNTALQDTVKTMLPSLIRGFEKVNVSLAQMTKGTLAAFKSLAESGGLDKLFDNIASGLSNAADAGGNFFDAFNTFAVVGSEYLPQFGSWITKITGNFRDWAKEAAETGKINMWIEQGVDALRDMGSLLSSSGSILKGFAIISDLSGAASLKDFATGLREVADTVNGEPFRSRMVTVFEGARRGTDALGEGFDNLMDVVGRSSRTIADFLDLTGQIGGILLSNFGVMADGTGLGGGLMTFLLGAKKAMEDIRPAFRDFGELVGSLAEIGSVLLTSMAPGLNKLFETVNDAVNAMEDGIKGAIPVFNEFIQGTLEVIAPVVVAVAGAFGSLLEAFVALPGPIRNLVMALGLLAFIWPKILGGVNSFFNTAGTAAAQLSPLQRGVQNLRDGFNNLRDPSTRAGAYIRGLRESFQVTGIAAGYAASEMNGGFRTALGNVGTALGRWTDPVRAFGRAVRTEMGESFRNAANIFEQSNRGMQDSSGRTWSSLNSMMDAGRDNMAVASNNIVQSADRIATEVPSRLSRMMSGVGSVATSFGDTVMRMGTSMRIVGTDLGNAFNGVNFGAIRGSLAELGGSIGGVAGQIGRGVTSGLRGAMSGLMGVLGGPWGAALAVGTTALMLYGQSLADSKQKVDDLAGTLDQASGKITNATKKMLAGNALDGATDDWDDFVRGAWNGSRSVEESLNIAGQSTQDYIDILSDQKGSERYIQGLRDIERAMRKGQPVTDSMARSVGSTGEAIRKLNNNDLKHWADKASDATDELQRAQEQIRQVGAATGTSSAAAAVMQANWDTLGSTASSASQKFSALKGNLELLTQAQEDSSKKSLNSVSAQKAYEQSLDSTAASIANIASTHNVLIPSLFSVADGFDLTSQAGRDLHTALEGQTDSILQLGTAAMDRALKGGADIGEAQKVALQAMQPAIDTLRTSLADLGFAPEQINAIVESFGLIPENITTALGVEGGEAARQEIFLTKIAAEAYSSGNYAGVLAALPQAAKDAIAEATRTAEAFASGDYQAVIEALNQTAGGVEGSLASILAITGPNADYDAWITARDDTQAGRDSAVAGINSVISPEYKARIQAQNDTGVGLNSSGVSINQFIRSDYTAPIKSSNQTFPGLSAARSEIDGLVNANHTAPIRAISDRSNHSNIDGELNNLARPRTAYIQTIMIGGQEKNQGTVIKNGQVGATGANGGIMSNMLSPFAGKLPMAKAFANGGFENHTAQISRSVTPYRIWAEPETGGEAYLPLSKSKRPRSLKILEEVARIFGFSLVKQFANGGITGFDNGPRGSGVSLSQSSESLRTRTVSSDLGGANVVMHVHPSQGLNEEQIAQAAMADLYWKLSTKIVG